MFTAVILLLMTAYVCIYLNLRGSLGVCVCARKHVRVQSVGGENNRSSSSSNIAHSMPGACCQPEQKGNVSILCAGRQWQGCWQIPVTIAFCLNDLEPRGETRPNQSSSGTSLPNDPISTALSIYIYYLPFNPNCFDRLKAKLL